MVWAVEVKRQLQMAIVVVHRFLICRGFQMLVFFFFFK